MKTLTVTAARQNLGAWLKRVLRGEDVGVMIDGEIVALRPVKVYSEDYAELEYGVTTEQLERAVESVSKELDADRKAGRLKRPTGKLKRGQARHRPQSALSGRAEQTGKALLKSLGVHEVNLT